MSAFMEQIRTATAGYYVMSLMKFKLAVSESNL